MSSVSSILISAVVFNIIFLIGHYKTSLDLWNRPPLWKPLLKAPPDTSARPWDWQFPAASRTIPHVMRRPRRFVVARALVKEMLPTLLLAAGVTTFLLLIRALFVLADLFIARSVELGTVVRLLVPRGSEHSRPDAADRNVVRGADDRGPLGGRLGVGGDSGVRRARCGASRGRS